MVSKSIAQAVAAPSRWFATLVAAVLICLFVIACVLLYVHADDAPEQVWNHWIKIFEALGPLVGLAIGWVFGKEVHRREAEDAKSDAKTLARQAGHGHALAEAVRVAASVAPTDQMTLDSSDDSSLPRSGHWDTVLSAANRLFPPESP